MFWDTTFLPGAKKSPPGLGKPSYFSSFRPFRISFGFFLLPSLFKFHSVFTRRDKVATGSRKTQSGKNRLLFFKLIQARPKLTSSISCHSGQAKTDFLHSNPFQSGQNRLPPFQPGQLPSCQAFLFKPKPTSSILSNSSHAKTDFLNFKLFQSDQNRLSPFQAIPGMQAKTNFLHSKPFQSVQNQLPLFQDIPVRPKPTSFIPSYSRPAKTDFLYSKPLQSGQNRLPPFQAMHSSTDKTHFLHSKPK
jgi:hypothetical protein